MKKAKQILNKVAEYYFIVLILLAGYSPPFSINPIALGLAGLLVVQVILKNRISGILITGLFFLINLGMLGALISELSEFPEFNAAAQKMLLVGLSIWFFNMFFAGVMFNKYQTIFE